MGILFDEFCRNLTKEIDERATEKRSADVEFEELMKIVSQFDRTDTAIGRFSWVSDATDPGLRLGMFGAFFNLEHLTVAFWFCPPSAATPIESWELTLESQGGIPSFRVDRLGETLTLSHLCDRIAIKLVTLEKNRLIGTPEKPGFNPRFDGHGLRPNPPLYDGNMLRVKLLEAGARLPVVAHVGEDLGYDVFAFEGATLAPRATVKVRTGIAVEARHPGTGAALGLLVRDRSSMAARGIITSGGVIDAGYRGEILVLMTNLGDSPVELKSGEKIAQMIPVPVLTGAVEEVSDLEDSVRAEKGFGSSGA